MEPRDEDAYRGRAEVAIRSHRNEATASLKDSKEGGHVGAEGRSQLAHRRRFGTRGLDSRGKSFKPVGVRTAGSRLPSGPGDEASLHCQFTTFDELANGSFRRVIPDASVEARDVKKVLLCTGKVFYDLEAARKKQGRTDVAILRLEQIYPLSEALVQALAPYKDGTPLVWVQEEPRNSGAWYFINANLRNHIGDRLPLSVVSRAASASPATGSKASHELEQKLLIEQAFAL